MCHSTLSGSTAVTLMILLSHPLYQRTTDYIPQMQLGEVTVSIPCITVNRLMLCLTLILQCQDPAS